MVAVAVCIFAVKYYLVSRADLQPGEFSEVILTPSEGANIGEIITARASIEAPWNWRPGMNVQVQLNGQNGIQLHQDAHVVRNRILWGKYRWTVEAEFQALQYKTFEGITLEVDFSNGSENRSFVLNVPPIRVEETEEEQSEEPASSLEPEYASAVPLVREDNFWGRIFAAVLGLLVIGLVLFSVRDLLFGGRKKKTEKPYWMLSIEKIEQLKTRTAAHELSLERAVARLTDIVRQYLEQRFLLPAAHLTTEEFMKNLEADGKSPLREQDRKFLKSFLNAADYVKFAGVSAEASMFQNAADKAEQLIRESSEGTAFNENEGQENAVRNGGGGMKNGI